MYLNTNPARSFQWSPRLQAPALPEPEPEPPDLEAGEAQPLAPEGHDMPVAPQPASAAGLWDDWSHLEQRAEEIVCEQARARLRPVALGAAAGTGAGLVLGGPQVAVMMAAMGAAAGGMYAVAEATGFEELINLARNAHEPPSPPAPADEDPQGPPEQA